MYSGFSADIQKSVDVSTSPRHRSYDHGFIENAGQNKLAARSVLNEGDARPSLLGDHSVAVGGIEASIFVRKGTIMVS